MTDKNSTAIALGTATTITFASGVGTASLVPYKAQGPVVLDATTGPSSSTGTGGSGATLTINNVNPVAQAHAIDRGPGLTLKILKTTLLAGATDANQDNISFSSVQDASGDATVSASGSYVYYKPGTAGDGATFTYTVSDGNGGSGTATVTIYLVKVGSVAKEIRVSGNTATITFFGAPNYQFDLQRSASSTGPWTTIDTDPASPQTSGSDGSYSFTDPAAPTGTAYYRSIQH